MTDNVLTLFCLVDGEATSNAFSIKMPSSDTVNDLKDLIKTKQSPDFDDIVANKRNLWCVSIPVVPKKERNYLADGSRPGTPLSGDLRVDFKKIADKFFAPGSRQANFLDAYVRGELKLKVTTSGVCVLPKVLRRGVVEQFDSVPSLLFLDLPEPPLSVCDPVPERFKSNILLGVLEKMQAQDLPVFGVSGCGKTRSIIEVLCLQWGFYFNAVKSDLGSDDFCRFSESIDGKTSEDQGACTIFAKNMTLVLFLSRLLILKYCLQIPNSRQTFSSASWAQLQVCPNMFEDVFAELFKVLFKHLHERVLFELVMTTVVQDEFSAVRNLLAAHTYPNLSSESKLRLVVDEAPVLSDKGSSKFQSSFLETDLRPMLSPILNGFRRTGGRNELTIIYFGTGFSIRTLHWAMSSGDGVKEYGSSIFPYVEFPGWISPASVQPYIDRIKSQLQDDSSKRMVDALIPPAAVNMLHKRISGRFRPITTAIEGIIKTGVTDTWENAIDTTEMIITSWKDRERRGNLCGELNRLEAKIANHPELFTSCSSLRETLGLFLFRYCLLDATEIALESEVQLVEAVFGRIKIFGCKARTVLDEPFVLKATLNYSREKDPGLVSAAERAMLHSDNASVHGCMWEAIMPPVFIETFKSRPLSSWPLLGNYSLPDKLKGDVTIVGYDEHQPKLAVSHRNLTTQQFMKAHVESGSKQGDLPILPFYFPAPHVSGPDIVLYVRISNKLYPVFVQ
ncbi:hypothetical protein BG004_003121 [Podila humilis]|nr:hypothetical protein BG004_003121 [Podila humilis]